MAVVDILPLRSKWLLLQVARAKHHFLISLWLQGPVPRILAPHLLHEPLLIPEQGLYLQHLLGSDGVKRASSVTALVGGVGLIQEARLLRY